ncbi:MAG TPA: tail fiber domain-containing protein [Verrucomicrobiota bacterium]|nr:tail fiber domain-containing protein [Verrucomicrobiota bacterium]
MIINSQGESAMKRLHLISKLISAMLIVACAAALALAAVPTTFTYQGRLTTSAGANVPDGSYLIRFVIYNAPTEGVVLWDNGYRHVTVIGGLFAYTLGDSTALPSTLFTGDTTRYLGIKVGADPEIIPRVKLNTVPFAFKALFADTAAMAFGVAGGGGGWTDGGPTVRLTTLTDKVSIGTNGANNKLDVTMTDATGGTAYFNLDNAANPTPALYSATSGSGHGISGSAVSGSSAGVFGYCGSGYGVQGSSASKYGIYGTGSKGVFGEHPTSHNYGYLGGLNDGVFGKDTSSGCSGTLGGEYFGVAGSAQQANEVGIFGECTSGVGIRASSTDSTGVYASSAFGLGVYGLGRRGVYGKGSTYGIMGEHSSSGNYATLGEDTRAILAEAIGKYDEGLLALNDSGGAIVTIASNRTGVLAQTDTGSGHWADCSGALAYYGKAVCGFGDSAGFFTGNVKITRFSEHIGGLTLHTDSHNDPGRCGIFFSNNQLGTLEGDDTEDQYFGFYSGFTGNRSYDAHLAVYGRNPSGWGSRIEMYHNGTDGYLATDVGDIALLPNLNVGVGTSTPGYKLDVAGSCHATSFPTSSDDRLKANVAPIVDALEKIEQINGVSFDWNERYDSLGRSSGHREIGVIAQEVEKVLPELVTTWGDQNYRAVDYGRLTAVLVEAVKQLAKENSSLNADNSAIRQRLDELQHKVEQLMKVDQ